jgi:mannose-6-phosphate isomerase class I
MAAINLRAHAGKVVRQANDDLNLLVQSPFFQVEKLKLNEPLQASVSPASPHIVVAIEGAAILESAGMAPVSFAKGEAVVVPASVPEYRVRPQWDAELMRMSLPNGSVAEPVTTLG